MNILSGKRLLLSSILLLAMLTSSQTILSQTRNRNAEQPNGSITGKVIDADSRKPILRATVTIHSKKDSSQIGGGYTDKSGNFNIKIKNGDFYAKVSFVGYDAKYINNVSVTSAKPKYECGTVQIKMSAVMTDEVQVVAKKEAVTVGLDRKVFNIEDDITSLGGSALDVLSNIPSVTVDQDDNVSLRGSEDVKIMIDGRVSNLTAAEALQQIPATMITSVELITNPGARYEADGTAGMINIVTTKERDNGFNAMVNLNGGTNDALDANFNGSVNLNYNWEKWNFFANFSGRKGSRSGTRYSYRTMWDSIMTPTYINSSENDNRDNMFFSGKIGADYNFTKNDVLTYSFRLNQMKRASTSNSIFKQFNSDLLTTNYYTRDESEEPPFATNIEHTLSYKHDFAQRGHELYVDVFYNSMDRSNTDNYIQKNYIAPDWNTNYYEQQQSNFNGLNTHNFAGQVDYAVPLGTNFKLEAGGKFSSRISDIDNHLDNYIDDNWITDENASDQFQYDEKIAALYVTGSSKIGNFGYNIGVRSETTIIDFTSEKDPTATFNDNYTLFFPSVYMSYEINPHHQFTANIASRMRRPGYWDLNPVTNYEDPLNLRKGNPSLRPESHYLGEVGYLLNYDAVTINATFFYRYSKDGIERYKAILNGDTTISTPVNITSSLRTGLDIMAMWKILNWWKVDASFSMFNNDLDASNLNSGIRKNAFNWSSRINSAMNITQQLSMTLSGRYRSKMLRAQGESDPNWSIDASFKYTLTDAISLSLRVRDIFNTRQWNSYEEIPNVLYYKMESENNSRSIYLGITYRFNEYQQKKEREFDDEGRSAESEEM